MTFFWDFSGSRIFNRHFSNRFRVQKKIVRTPAIMADDESIENEDKDCIEKILRNIGDCENVELDMIKCMPGSRQGDNYMSVVKRIILKGRHGSRSGKCKYRFLCFSSFSAYHLV